MPMPEAALPSTPPHSTATGTWLCSMAMQRGGGCMPCLWLGARQVHSRCWGPTLRGVRLRTQSWARGTESVSA
jgi:hypothetical protein